MDFATAVRTCLTEKFATFSGRASRSEYWWFVLAYVIGAIVLSLIGIWVLQVAYSFALFIPAAAAGYRRLQDTGRAGWYIFVPMIYGLIGNFIPQPAIDASGMPTQMPNAGTLGFTAIYGLFGLILAIMFLWWLTRPGQEGDNDHGPQPAA